MGGVVLVALTLHVLSRREDADPGRIVSECADGSVIGERLGRVRRRPGRTRGQRSRLALGATGGRAIDVREDLGPGDLGGVRIREGREGESAWVVEGLDPGRARIAIRWEFETVDDALPVLRLLDARVVARPAAGRPAPSDAEFDSAGD
jgi:hypothetical protein